MTSLHAIGLLAIPLLALATCLRYGWWPVDGTGWWERVRRVGLVLLIGWVVLFLLMPDCQCGPGNNPVLQRWLPLLSVAAVALVVSRPTVRWAYVVAALLAGWALSLHFHALVLDPDACQYTGGGAEALEYSCATNAQAVPLWHTVFTGIQGLERR